MICLVPWVLHPWPSSTQGVHINHHQLAPIVVTGGATLAAIVVLSKIKSSTSKTPVPFPFTNLTITSSFIAAIPEITPEINLELATATQTEVFTKSSVQTLWGIGLGISTVQIRVPVTYRYHLCLKDPWHLEVQGQRVTVRAPVFRPSLPPAIHTDKMERLAVRGWLRGSTSDLMEQLQREITPVLNLYASDAKHLELVRGQCRQSVAEFVKLWLERENLWGRQDINEIQVLFPAEDPAQLP